MIDTIEKALNPLTLAIFFSGLGILRHPLNHPRFCLSIFYMLTVWSVYACVFSCVLTIFSPQRIFNNTLDLYMIMTSLLVTIISLIISIRKHEEIYSCVKKLGLVDDTLEKLGIPKEYREIRNSVKRTLIVYFILIGTIFTTDTLWNIEKHNDTRAVMISFAISYSFHVNSLLDITFTCVLRYIGIKLDKINDHIEELSETEEYGLRCAWKKSLVVSRHYIRNAENRKRVLWIAMHLHLELCRIARDLNNLFGIQMTLQMISYFIVFVVMFDFQYHTGLCLKQIYGRDIATLKVLLCADMWCIAQLMKLLSLNHICDSVSAKARKTKGIIHKLTNLIRFTDAREEIRQFVLQISLLPLKFNGMGLFYFGYRFVRKFFIWVLAVIIFMLQMDTSPITRTIKSGRLNLTCY